MTQEIWIVLIVVAAAFIAFWSEIIAAELVGLIAILTLGVLGVVTPRQAFHGFGSPALVMIASILILSAALIRNGAGERLAYRIQGFSGGGAERMAFVLFISVTFVSAFINNVAATAMFLPVAESLAQTYRIRPSRLLMPVAYASLLGGVCTLTGTSTNVVIAGLLGEANLEPLGVFELSPVGIPLALVGLSYLLVFSRWLPGRAGSEDDEIGSKDDDRRLFMTELEVPEGSPAIGRTLREMELRKKRRLSPLGLIRGAVRLSDDVLDTPLRAADVVVVEGDVLAINRGVRAMGLIRKKTSKRLDTGGSSTAQVEATISYNSPLIGRTLQGVDLRGRYGLNVIAVWRRGGPVIEKIGKIRLRLGDDLLIQGPLDRIRQVAGEPLYLLLADRVLPHFDPKKEFRSLAVFAVALALGFLNVIPIQLAFFCGAILVILAGCLSLEEAYRSLNMKLVVLIGSMLGVAHALETSGAATFLSEQMLGWIGGEQAPRWLVLAGFYWLTVLLTQPMSNAAAASLMLPIALASAQTLGVDPRPLVITVVVAASLAFMTPLEPACLLVMSTGRYRIRDFLRFGIPLTLICFAGVFFLVPILFPW